MLCLQAGSVLRVRKPAAAGGAIGSPETKAKGMRHLTALELELWEPLLQLLPEDACKDEQGM